MELLVVTLAHIIEGRDADILVRIRQIADTVRNAPGLITSHMYRGREQDSYYVSAAHITTLRPDQARLAQREWITSLRKQAMKPTLAFAFLAQEIDRDATAPFRAVKPLRTEARAEEKFVYYQGTTLLNFLSWASETEREEFYKDPHYQSIKKLLESLAVTRILPLEQV